MADVFDALTTQRPYKAAMSFAAALACIRAESGRHFDPACVAAFCARWPDIGVAGGQGQAEIRPRAGPVTEPWARVPTLFREIAAAAPEPAGWLVRNPHTLVAREGGTVNPPPPVPPLTRDSDRSRSESRPDRAMDDGVGDRAGAPHLPGRGAAPGGRDGPLKGLPHARHGLSHLTAARPEDGQTGRTA